MATRRSQTPLTACWEWSEPDVSPAERARIPRSSPVIFGRPSRTVKRPTKSTSRRAFSLRCLCSDATDPSSASRVAHPESGQCVGSPRAPKSLGRAGDRLRPTATGIVCMAFRSTLTAPKVSRTWRICRSVPRIADDSPLCSSRLASLSRPRRWRQVASKLLCHPSSRAPAWKRVNSLIGPSKPLVQLEPRRLHCRRALRKHHANGELSKGFSESNSTDCRCRLRYL
ncbi:uncharacterized protein B0I36DRAFT_92513 [Microdochium trichocladiopsis]|uniref:Uncharacterized protein n=1 Tax=Microdochium trichocladiopsis TaxID=1682393 RepID=A0A9P9BTF2_9PEZI|nr:uncharacterized protein B0I36DRAFT_92513 [Microdochium trichocladiopsis]KAH7035432.1 hypothetical protein B0I36DRAFT_92513 [Microdochium trichocladiopsis]